MCIGDTSLLSCSSHTYAEAVGIEIMTIHREYCGVLGCAVPFYEQSWLTATDRQV